jgi:hypothetical protein
MKPVRKNSPVNLTQLTDEALITLRAGLEIEMRRRKIAFSVGGVGEKLVLAHFNSTAGLPKLQLAPPGTKNVDALSRNGDRYSVKTVWKAKKTGTIYPDPTDKEKQLFEFLLIVKLDGEWELRSIHQIPWQQFVRLRAWDKRMNAWYLPCSRTTLKPQFVVYDAAGGSA